MHRLRLVAITFSLALAGCQQASTPTSKPTGDAAHRRVGRVDFQPCALSGLMGAPTIDGMCATLRVPENPAAPTARKIDLHIAWLRSDAKGEPAPDPVFFLAGGPGQAAGDYASVVSGALRDVRKQRDIYLVDQRGTGKSTPIECPKSLDAQFEKREDLAAVGEYATACASTLNLDPRYFTTSVAIDDLDTVRRALGIERINLVGVSYGTRVAQQYAKRYPKATRTLVLDGVAPNDVVVGGEFPRMFERVLELRGRACKEDAACNKRYPQDLRTGLAQLKARLAANPVEVEYRDPQTGEIKRETLTAQTVVSLSQLFSYVPQAAALLPVVIDDAVHEHYGPLMALASMGQSSMAGGMNRGMQWSVICAEDADRYVPNAADANSTLGTLPVEQFFAACKGWPTGTRPKEFTAPLTGDVPALLMSGELDPVTPPEYADRVAKPLRNARALTLRGQGHNVIGVGCMPKLVGQFIESANAKALDAKCLDNVAPVPPFTSFNGWEP